MSRRPEIRRIRRPYEDPLAPARGIIVGILLASILWTLIALLYVAACT